MIPRYEDTQPGTTEHYIKTVAAIERTGVAATSPEPGELSASETAFCATVPAANPAGDA